MNPNQSKSPNAENEEKLLQFWHENNVFEKTLTKDAPNGEYNFFEGPPTANGKPGIHHVAARSFKDIIPRYKTMRGFSVRRKAGWDTHGLPVELQVEKALGLKSKKEIEAYGVAEFNKKCKESVWTYKDEWEKLTERMGFWLDMKDPYITYDNGYIEALWGIVKKINDRGHLYRDFRVGPWCPRCGTTLSSHELNQPGAYKDIKDLSVYVKFPIVGFDKAYFLAWTTTPWTLPGNVALAVGADIDYVEAKVGDEILVLAKELVKILPEGFEIIAEHKGSEMVGMKYEPLFPFMKNLVKDQDEKMEKAYQVYTADFVTTTDGTGMVHTAVMYGADDFELGTKVGLPKFHTVNEEGKFIAGCDTDTLKLSGRYVKEEDEKGKPTLAVDIVNDLTAQGLLFKKENYTHSYPHCWRCDTPLIYYARTSWYFATSKLRQQLLDANEKINWEPDHIKEGRFGEWLDGIKDWAISRDRYWGTPLPVWSTASGKNVVIGSIDELRKYSKEAVTKIIFIRHGQSENNVLKFSASARDKYPLTNLGHEQAKQVAEQLIKEPVDVVYGSPILRARQTAEPYLEKSGHKMIIDDRLAEINSGDWEEKTSDDPSVQAEREAYKALDLDGRHNAKRGRVGESWADLDVRIGGFLDEIIEKNLGKTIVCFSHQGTNTAGIKKLKGLSNKDAVFNVFEQLENGEISSVFIDSNRKVEFDLHKPYIDQVELELDGEKLTRTPEVMDVWFDSGSMPMAQDHKLGEDINFDAKPADYIAEGVDQTRGWFYTMHAIANMLHDKPTEAYKNVICMGLLMDANGQKMSKSRGNVVEPWEMFNKYGADVVRFWFYSVNQPGESKNFDENSLAELQNKFFRVIENSFQMLEMYGGGAVIDTPQPMNLLDKWIWSYLAETNREMTKALDAYDMFTASRKLKDFVTDFSQWYIRLSRDNLRTKPVSRGLMMGILQQLALLLAPFAPFTAEEMWRKIYGTDFAVAGSVHLAKWPEPNKFSDVSEEEQQKILSNMNIVRDIVSNALFARQKAGVKVRQPLAKLTIAKVDLEEEYLDLIKDELNVKEVVMDETLGEGAVQLDVTITEALRGEGLMRELSRQIQEMRKDAGLMPSDRVVVYLTDQEPTWYHTHRAELFDTVGAEDVVWGSSEARVEKIG